MDNIFGSSLSFWEMLMLIIASLGIMLTIRVKFDLNQHLKSRRKNIIYKAQNVCTHMKIELGGNNFTKYTILFESPSGTLQWQCSRCKLIVNNIDKDYYQKMAQYYIKKPKEYKKHNQKFEKLLKKAGFL